MPLAITYSLLSVVAISIVSLIGVITVLISRKYLNTVVLLLVALAVGAFLGDAFIHLIPEAFEEATSPLITSLLIIAGILSFFILEKILHWHHHAHINDPCEDDNHPTHLKPLGKIILISDAIHNLIDGIIIGVSYLISIEVGIATTIAVLLHEVPQEMGDFGILLRSGYSKKRALLYNFIAALFSILGVILVVVAQDFAQNIATFVVPLIAGIFIYIATADLVPELNKEEYGFRTLFEIGAVIVGVFLMYLLTFLEV